MEARKTSRKASRWVVLRLTVPLLEIRSGRSSGRSFYPSRVLMETQPQLLGEMSGLLRELLLLGSILMQIL